MKIFDSIEGLVGNTPLLRLTRIEKQFDIKATLLAKLEYLNPAGSVKDRVAKAMILGAEQKGQLKTGGTIIEPTSGNTGIGLASIGVSKGYKVILTMPNTMSEERIKLLKAYGAEVVLTDGALGMQGAIEKAQEINKNTSNSIIAGQFDNPLNPKAHYDTTAQEIWQDTDGRVDILVGGLGSCGTICGTAKRLKEYNPNINVIGVEPASSPLITKGQAGKHKIQGIGANFIPKNYNASVVDKVITASDDSAYDFARLVAKTQGVLVGISSGAALSVAVEIAKQKQNENKVIVVIFPDSGDRYLSTDLF